MSRARIMVTREFVKTEKQRAALAVINNHMHGLLYGGSRSGKTTIIVRNIILRAMKEESRHLMTRFRFNHAKTSLWYDTIPKVFRMCFPGVPYNPNKSDWFIEVPVRNGRGMSQIWLGGIDDKERVEKILGNEYSTIYANEASQISYDAITTLRTRLAENSGLNLKFYYDLNPSGKKHWSYREFIEGVNPEDENEKSIIDRGHYVLNPYDNIANLPPDYIKILEALPKRKRQRFLEGLYLTDVEGALWNDQMISYSNAKAYGDIIKTVVAVDPAITNTSASNETGIIICSLDENREGIVEKDLSLKGSPNQWAQRVVNAYHAYGANEVVAEVNQGGDMVEAMIKNIDKSVKVVKVRASKGKFARAEPVAALYEQNKVRHMSDLHELETQLTEYVPLDADKSPDRLDALVWGLTRLMVNAGPQIHVG